MQSLNKHNQSCLTHYISFSAKHEHLCLNVIIQKLKDISLRYHTLKPPTAVKIKIRAVTRHRESQTNRIAAKLTSLSPQKTRL